MNDPIICQFQFGDFKKEKNSLEIQEKKKDNIDTQDT